MYVYMFVHTCVFGGSVCICMCLCVCACICAFVCGGAHMYVSGMSACVHMFICVYVQCACMYVSNKHVCLLYMVYFKVGKELLLPT